MSSQGIYTSDIDGSPFLNGFNESSMAHYAEKDSDVTSRAIQARSILLKIPRYVSGIKVEHAIHAIRMNIILLLCL